MLMILPAISLLAHISTSNWIYNVRWYPANVAPVMLGLAMALGASDTHVGSLGWRMKLQFWLPLVALAMSVRFPSHLIFTMHSLGFSPLRLVLLASTVVYLYGFVLHRHILFACGACACISAAGMGMTARQILDNFNFASEQSYVFSKRLWPRTMTHWGWISMVASFVLLMLGAVVSLKKPLEVKLEAVDDSRELGT